MTASPTIQLLALPFIVLLIAAGWLVFVRVRFGLKRPPGVKLTVRATDGWLLSGRYRRAAQRRYVEPVLLAHGLSTNHLTFDFDPPYSLAHALNQAGFDTYAVDFRGALESSIPLLRGWSVEDHVQKDAPAFINEILAHSGAKSAFWIGHSLGGLIGYAVASGPEQPRLSGIVTLGSPVYLELPNSVRFSLGLGTVLAFPFGFRHRLLAQMMAPFLGHIALPLSDVLVNPVHIAPAIQRRVFANIIDTMGYRVLRQFKEWSVKGPDQALAQLRIPTLIIGGDADRMASAQGVAKAFAEVASEDKTMAIFGKRRGDQYDYGHGDYLFGSGAPTEVFPLIIEWLSKRATPS